MSGDDLLGSGPTYVAPPTFRYLHIAKDYPAKEALETIVNYVAARKSRQMAEVDFFEALYELGRVQLDDLDDLPPDEVDRRFPKYAAWFTFDMGLDDLPGAPPVDGFRIELLEADQFVDEDAPVQTSVLSVALAVGYDGIGLIFRFIREPEALYCECNVSGWQGDGQEMTNLAEHLRRHT